MSTDKVKVAVRVRPFNRREVELNTESVVEVNNQQIVLNYPKSERNKTKVNPKVIIFLNTLLVCLVLLLAQRREIQIILNISELFSPEKPFV